MARKLIVSNPPPAETQPSTVQLQALPTDDAGLIRLWRPQAAMLARKGSSEFAIARFLHSKGVEGVAARLAAREIMENPGKSADHGDILMKITGFLLFSTGLLVPVACLALGIRGFAGTAAACAALLAVAIGCRLLWIARK